MMRVANAPDDRREIDGCGLRPRAGVGPSRRTLLRALLAGAATWAGRARSAMAATPSHHTAAPFAFALIGDVPYNALEVRMLERVFESLEPDLAFALHVGDIKAGWEPCSDALLDARVTLLESSPLPLVYVPGDNEWTDCGATRSGQFDPRERLDWLRERVFAQRNRGSLAPGAAKSLARLAPIERHGDRFAEGLPENLRWRYRNVRFVTLNVPGSNNGLRADGLDRDDWRRRSDANAQWLLDTYRLAAEEGAAALVVAVHANPRFGVARSWRASNDGYAAFRALLVDASNGFAGPTLLVHGDTHHHRVERLTPKLLRVESYGTPYSHRWVRIDFDPRANEPFRVASREAKLPSVES